MYIPESELLVPSSLQLFFSLLSLAPIHFAAIFYPANVSRNEIYHFFDALTEKYLRKRFLSSSWLRTLLVPFFLSPFIAIFFIRDFTTKKRLFFSLISRVTARTRRFSIFVGAIFLLYHSLVLTPVNNPDNPLVTSFSTIILRPEDPARFILVFHCCLYSDNSLSYTRDTIAPTTPNLFFSLFVVLLLLRSPAQWKIILPARNSVNRCGSFVTDQDDIFRRVYCNNIGNNV